MIGFTQPKPEKKFMPLPDQNQQKSENPPLHDKAKELERNSSDKHGSMPILGKTQPKLLNKYMPLPFCTQQKS